MPTISAESLSREERTALYRSKRSPNNDDWTPREIALNRAAHDRIEAQQALVRAEFELRVQVAEAVKVEGVPLERVAWLSRLDEEQVRAHLVAIERHVARGGTVPVV